MMLLQILMITFLQMICATYDKGARWQSQVLECDPTSVGGKYSKSRKPVPGKWFPAYDEPTSNAISAFLNSAHSLPKGHVGGNTTVCAYHAVIQVGTRKFIISMSHDGKPQQLSFNDHTVVRDLQADPEIAAFRAEAGRL